MAAATKVTASTDGIEEIEHKEGGGGGGVVGCMMWMSSQAKIQGLIIRLIFFYICIPKVPCNLSEEKHLLP